MKTTRGIAPKLEANLPFHFRAACLCALTFLASSAAIGQEKSTQSKPAYLELGFGLNPSSFRDLATSPLSYSGIPVSFSLSHIEWNKDRTSSIRLGYSFGNYQSDYNDQNSASEVDLFVVDYQELFRVSGLSNDPFNFRLGGAFNGIAHLRNNPNLRNNGLGFEIMTSLSGVARGSFTFGSNGSRTSVLSFGLQVGLVNGSYRNGYAYMSSSIPLNNDDLFADYTWSLLRGMRWQSNTEYTFFLKNGNAIQLSYHWDAYKTGSTDSDFEMAHHLIEFSLLFKLNN